MAMTGREIVDRAVHFGGPERVGMTLPKPYPNDLAGIRPDPAPGFDERLRIGRDRHRTTSKGVPW